MARIRIPPPDVPAIDPNTGRWTDTWYDVIKGLERLGALDLFDVNAAPTDTQTLRWNAATSKFIPGA